MYAKTINLLWAGNKVLWNIKLKGEGLTPNPSLAHALAEYKQSTLQARISEENTINATTQQFTSAKISGCALKQGSKTHSSLRPSNFQLQNEAALMSLSITSSRAYKVCGLTGWRTPLFARSNLAKLQENWECAWSTQENFQFFIMCIVQQTFSFPFSLLRHFQIPECFHVKKSSFWARATVLSCYRNCWCSHCG